VRPPGQCIAGGIGLRPPDARHVLEAGDFIHLRRNQPHPLGAHVDTSAPLTLRIAKAS
jgi:quercetin dioxygenase-like cupin family protein